ncbi:MAG: hypothetical protein NTU98_12810 [Bacteroidetes bacterium]|nr:hypothetical protein [Bacteroidota bacterium]
MKKCIRHLSGLMMILSILVFAFQLRAQTTLLTEGWNTASGTTPPAGWAIGQLGYGSWTSFVTSGSFPVCTPYEGSGMVNFDSWNAAAGYENRLYMMTSVSTIGFTNIKVDFALLKQTVYSGDGVYVEWSVNGTTWTTAGALFNTNGTVQQWQVQTQALPVGAANQATLYVALRFHSNWGYDVYTDLLHITGLQTGNLTGTVRNCFNNGTLAGVTVSCGGLNATTNPSGIYTLNGITAGPQIITASLAGFLPHSEPVMVIANTTTTHNLCLDPIPGYIAGVVTSCETGSPIIGARVSFSTFFTYTTGANPAAGTPAGYYKITVYPGMTSTLQCTKPGFTVYSSPPITASPPVTVTFNFCMHENVPAPGGPFSATVNANQTSVTLNWGLPVDDMVLLFDDGIQDNFAIWATGGGNNLNAVRFTPISYPCIIKGFYVNIGQSTNYTASQNAFTLTQMAIFSDIGGLPGVQLSAPTTVTPAIYGWTKANFDAPVTISNGNFFIAMIQLGNSAASPGIAIDTTVQQLRSFSKFGSTPWIPGPGNYMIRAIVNGSGGPLMLGK